jgi:hypothetical protein
VLSPSQLDTVIERAGGLGSVTGIEAVATASDQAQQALGTDASDMPSTPVDLVVLHGSFVDTMSKAPAGEPDPSGSVAAYTVDQASGEIGLTYIGDASPNLRSLGAVESLSGPSADASMSRVSRAARVRRRLRGRVPRARAATWGNNCKLASESHCYSQARWSMTGGEQVLGSEAEIDTTTMSVPGSTSGDFVTNEEWVSFPSTGYWMEMGQQAGEYKGCCSLWWFWAFENSTGYHQHTTAAEGVWEVTFNSWNMYGFKGTGTSRWCWYVAPDWEGQIGCESGFSTYSKVLTDGMEAATEEKPSVAGMVQVNAEWTNGNWNQWNKATNSVVNYKNETTSGLCVSQYTPWNWPGNINYGTC